MTENTEGEKRELKEEEKALIAGVRPTLRKYQMLWHPDKRSIPVAEAQKIKERPGAISVPHLLNIIINYLNTNPEMCSKRPSGEIEISLWPPTDQISDETSIYLPSNSMLPEGKFVPIPQTPQLFFQILDDYAAGRDVNKAYVKGHIQQAQGPGSVRDWMRKMSYFIEFVREAPDLATLKRMTLPVPKGEKWPAAHTNSFTQSQRYSGIVLDGKNVFIDSEVDLRGLQIISALREKVDTTEELGRFLKEVAEHGFFHVSARIKANQIVRVEINKHLARVKNSAELELLRTTIENSGILRRLTPQGRTGLRRALDNIALKLPSV